jgi:hypothetical protein
MKFRKKPVVIEALLWTGCNWARMRAFLGVPDDEPMFPELRGKEGQPLLIKTLEGDMRAEVGDWIIRGVKGEFYPCKPDIFASTYEPLRDEIKDFCEGKEV